MTLFQCAPSEVAESAPTTSVPIAAQVARVRLRLVVEPPVGSPARPEMHRPGIAAEFFASLLESRPQEVMLAAYLDSRCQLICWQQVFVGHLTRMSVAPGPILQAALLANASGVILAHNHPSGDPTPSPEDMLFTRRFAKAAEVVGIRLVDHLTIGSRDWWVSLRKREGW